MSSRRKSTTPCMVLPSDVVEQDPDIETLAGEEGAETAAESPAEGAAVPMETEGGEGCDALVESEGDPEPMEASVLGASITADMMNPVSSESAKPGLLVSIPNPVSSEQKKPVLNPAAVLPAGLAQVLSALQAQQSAQAQLLIPLSSIPTYNAAMDSNALLVNTYKKFPYPSASEIMGLAAQTKFSEEQIKIWFSAQRLKHGVSWTPEEVEEARRKQFNGTVHTVPQTITVIPAHHLSATNGLQSILQTCQIVGQPGLVLTQVGTANSLPVTTPITLTVAGMPHQSQAPKIASNQTSPAISETKRATTVQPPSLTPQENSALISDHFGLRPKKSKEQLAELKASYLKNHFASDAEIARLMKLTNLTKGEIKKWFSDTRYNHATIIIDSNFTLQKFKEKTPEQLVILEESYQKCDTPSDEELSRLRAETKLTRREIDAWFTEKRKTPVPESAEKNDGAEGESSQGKRSQTPPGAKKMVKEKLKKTPEQLHVLKSAFVRSQWPSTEEYDQLSEESGLPRPYIVNWFGDTRYAWKNGNLKWYFYYQSGNVEGMNGNKGRKRRIRNRGWGRSRSRKAKKSTNLEKPPPIKFKTGKDILKEYYLKHKFLNEQDLDELVAKSNMSYEQVREWFAEVCRKVDMGADPFDDNVNNEQEEEESQGENEIVGEEQGPSAPGEEEGEEDEEEEDDETDDSESWEPPQSVRKTLSGSEDQ
uniref:Zinc fingers and homeoboxes protein 1 n=1 Tax=Astyanax mexicanus TaxID=7994 RepID=A0A8B9L633_ASTMX